MELNHLSFLFFLFLFSDPFDYLLSVNMFVLEENKCNEK